MLSERRVSRGWDAHLGALWERREAERAAEERAREEREEKWCWNENPAPERAEVLEDAPF